MVKIAGSKKLKRQMAPMFWGIARKEKRFVVTVKPGPHKKNNSIPTAVLLRDKMKVVSTLREAKSVIYSGKITIDGVKRKSLHHGIGLMDVVELDGISDSYRLVPKDGTILTPIKINADEKNKKIVKVTGKTSMKGGKTQIKFHDGRTLISDELVDVNDSCVLQIPEQKILEVIKLEKNTKILITSGVNAGKIGEIKEIKEGTFVLTKRIITTIDDKLIEIPIRLVIAVGKDKPVMQIR
ncbi:MAG: 30S ribosomal protein S4e [Thermoproteota archaeon]|nr:30S ribosomal protein S4e [Thermoproteota archaeon]